MSMISFVLQVYELAQECGIKVHLDGARVMHAAVALGVEPADIMQYVDSVNMCFSKVRDSLHIISKQDPPPRGESRIVSQQGPSFGTPLLIYLIFLTMTLLHLRPHSFAVCDIHIGCFTWTSILNTFI